MWEKAVVGCRWSQDILYCIEPGNRSSLQTLVTIDLCRVLRPCLSYGIGHSRMHTVCMRMGLIPSSRATPYDNLTFDIAYMTRHTAGPELT